MIQLHYLKEIDNRKSKFHRRNNKKGSDFIQVIETNIAIDSNNIIRDHQSRIVEVDSWETYCKAYEEYDGKSIAFYSKGMPGNTIQSNCKILDLIYDEIHLSCKIVNHQIDFAATRLAYIAF